MFSNPFQMQQPQTMVNTPSIQDLQAQLQLLLQKQNQTNLNPNQKLGGAFGKLQDFIQNTDKAKVNFANNDEIVASKYNEMKDVFVLFMLENSRPQFESWCNTRGINVVNDYVDAFIQKSNEYVEPEVKQENEIEMLKKQILELQKQLANRRDVI